MNNTRKHQTLIISTQTIIRDIEVNDLHLVDRKYNGYVVLESMPGITWLVRQVDPQASPSVWMIVGWVRAR